MSGPLVEGKGDRGMSECFQHELSVPRLAGILADGPFAGMEYATGTIDGRVDHEGIFWYRPGETVTFRIGHLTIGSATGAPVLTVADLTGLPPGTPMREPEITNRAVLLQTLTLDAADRPHPIGDTVRTALSGADIDFSTDERDFVDSAAEILTTAGLTCTTRTPAQARNRLRRAMAGIEKRQDVQIPMRDGTVLLADVFLPTRHRGPFPALVRLGIYGKAFGFGSAVTPDEILAAEDREDEWFEGDRSALPWIIRYSENLNSANSMDWVPRGYALVRIAGRGIGGSGGTVAPFSHQEVDDYYDAIQWVADQDWCDGNVGLKGSSYQSINQWSVAARRPPALRAIAPFATDQDFYRDLLYPGGLYHTGFWHDWWPNMVLAARPQGQGPSIDFLAGVEGHPFDGDWWLDDPAAPAAGVLEDIDIPVMVAVSQMGIVHGRGGFEAFRRLRSDKYLSVVDAAYASYEHHDTLQDHFDFFDKYLKGHDKEIPRVRMLVRKGGNEIDWRVAETWPPPETAYRYLHLDAAGGAASETEPVGDAVVSYSADPDGKSSTPGAFFLTEPMTEDVLLAGHFAACVTLSSSTTDADLFVSVRAFDGEDEVRFATRDDSASPISWGFLRSSQRAVDPDLSTPERPWHTHRQEDVLLLQPGEPVQLQVEMLPATALVKRGWRIRVDLTPVEPGVLGQYFEGVNRTYGDYHRSAVNSIHTGPSAPSWVRLPTLPIVEPTET